MHRRAVRLSIAVVLLASGAVAASVAWSGERRIAMLAAAERDVAMQIERLSSAVADVAAAQQAYLAPGGSPSDAFERVSAAAQQIATELAAVRSRARSKTAAATLSALTGDLSALLAADRQIREHVTSAETLLAADLITGAAHEVLTAMGGRLKDLREAEAAAYAAERDTIRQRTWTTIGGVAFVWTIGLLLLAPLPRHDIVAPTAAAVPGAAVPRTAPAAASPPPDRLADLVNLPNQSQISNLKSQRDTDLAAAADLCTAISRVTSTEALPELLERAAHLLDASGLIVWMGAGDELFAAVSHGYDARIIGRLGTIKRTAENATAAAWRTGALQIVDADAMSNGAIVAPMFGPDRCIGVFAVEVRHGREQDAATRAVATMIAAQLATAIAAWPAPSEARREASGTGPQA